MYTAGIRETVVPCTKVLRVLAALLAYLPPTSSPGAVGQFDIVESTNAGGVASSQSSTAQSLLPPLVGRGHADFGSFTAFLGYVKSVAIP